MPSPFGGRKNSPQPSEHDDRFLAKPVGRKVSRNSEGFVYKNLSFASAEQMRLKSLNPLNRSPITHWPTICLLSFEFLKHGTAWLSNFADTEFATTIILCSLIPTVRADKGERLARNLLSDIAPLIALFGEQVTKQFLSESMGWADNILFAMAPLGIITAIISTIRVGGPSWLKAIVGRSREGRAEVELELMSSNSPDVGEMWNGQTIVRVLGTPPIFQLVYAPEKITTEADPAKYIGTLDGENHFFRSISRRSSSREHIEGEYNHDIELHPLLRSTGHPQQTRNEIYPPNISLNARGEPVRGWENWVWALIGILVQLIVLAYEGLITYNTSWGARFVNPDEESSTQAFQLTAAGTVALTFGMLICSYVVEGASIETDWVRTGRSRELKVAWIQKGGIVNDQVFDSYIILGHEGQRVVRTSQRSNDKVGVKIQYWVLLGTFVSIAGFIIQFAGLRGMSWTATVVQLAAMSLMTIVRSIVRRRMSRIPTAIKVIEGHELDCMAQTIGGCDGWEVVPGWGRQAVDDRGLAERVLKIRKHLGGLVQWPTDVQHIAHILCTAMEKTMDTIYKLDEIQLAEDFLEAGEFSWKLVVLTLEAHPLATKANQNSRGQPAEPGGRERRGELTFKLTRSRELDVWGPWEISEDTRIEIIAVLSLWLLRFREEENNYRYRNPSRRSLEKNAKVFQVWPSGIEQEYFRSWMGGQEVGIRAGNLANILRQEKLPAHRLVGCKKSESAQSVVILSDTSIQALFAQQIFSDFFSAVASPIKAILGSTKIRALASLSSSENSFSDLVDHPQRLFGEDGFKAWEIENSALTQLAETVSETGLGTKQEVLMSTLPHLGMLGRLPLPPVKPGSLLQHSFIELRYKTLRMRNHWYTLALQIQQLTLDHRNYIGDDLEIWNARHLAIRFCKRILALTIPGRTNTPDHPQKLFLAWLENMDWPPIPNSHPDAIDLPDEVVRNLGDNNAVKIRKLLAPFRPVPRTLLDQEVKFLRETMDITNPKDMVQALMEAARGGYDSVVEALRDRGLDTTQKDGTGESPLTLAASQGHDSVVQLLLLQLLVHSPKVYSRFQAGYQPAALWNAANSGHISTVNLLIVHTRRSDITRGEQPRTALILAAGNGHVDLVKALLANRVDANTNCTERDVYKQPAVQQLQKQMTNSKTLRSRAAELQRGGASAYQDLVMSLLNNPEVDTVAMAISMRTALQTAAEGGHLSVVEQLLKSGAEVNAPPALWYGRTALQAAAGGGHLAVVCRLLVEGANVNAPAALWYGRTALQAAAEGGHLAVVDQLLEKGAEVNVPASKSGLTALQAAAGGGHLAVVDRLLENDAEVNAPASTSGRTALQAAAEGGNLAVVDRLLENGAEVNVPASKSGLTALQAAAGGGHLAVVDRLLKNAARVNVSASTSGRTALEAAAEGGHLDVVDRLLDEGAEINALVLTSGRTVLQAAAEGGNQAVVDRLLKSGAEVNAPARRDGRTALQAAAGCGHLAVVHRLLNNEADINAHPAEGSGRTALQAAAEGGHADIVDLLLNRRAEVNAPASTFGRTALQAAAGCGHLTMVGLLLEKGAKINVPASTSGRTALQAAAGGGHLAMVDLLLEKGAEVNAHPAPMSGRTALQAAAEYGHLAVADRLLDNGAEVNAYPAPDCGRTALQAAAGYGHGAMVDLLLEKGAKINAPASTSGRTALQAAAGGGHLAVVDHLLKKGAKVNTQALASGRTALQAAAEGGHLAVVDRLLENNAEVNAPPALWYGRTTLQAAAEGGHLAVIERLLENGADVNAEPACRDGRTALQAAAGYGHLAVVEQLLDLAAEVNAPPALWYGRTALQAAAGSGHLAVVEQLLAWAADVNALPAVWYGRTALQAAAGSGHLAVVGRLLKRTAKVTSPALWYEQAALRATIDNSHLTVIDQSPEKGAEVNAPAGRWYGRTALQAAAGGGHLAVVDRLLEEGSEVNAQPVSDTELTALQAAAEGGHLAILNRLLENGANVNTPVPGNGRTALQAAEREGHLTVAKRLREVGAL